MGVNNFAVGDRVRVIPDSELTIDGLHNLEGYVVFIREGFHGESVDVILSNHPYTKSAPPDQIWQFHDAVNRLKVITGSSSNNGRQEKPCQLCSRPNDVGVSVCWSCGNQPF